MTILVTGGTGTLGRPTVDRLRTVGRNVRVLSRRPALGDVVGDLATGAGVEAAVEGADTIAHLALGATREADYTRRVVDAAAKAGVRHLFYMSIVGVDRIPLRYYREKIVSERIVENSGVPFTILRATQFHQLLARIFGGQRRSPVMLSVRGVSLQPIDAAEVAERVAGLLTGPPAGRAPDIGGPEQLPLGELIATWQRAHGRNRPVWTVPVGGRTITAYRRGHQLTTLPGYGRTFAEYLGAQPDSRR